MRSQREVFVDDQRVRPDVLRRNEYIERQQVCHCPVGLRDCVLASRRDKVERLCELDAKRFQRVNPDALLWVDSDDKSPDGATMHDGERRNMLDRVSRACGCHCPLPHV